jgi:hypothetical protein
MDPLEQELKQALARKAPPTGFAERIAARTRRRATPRWLTTAAAMLIIAGGAGAWRYRQGIQAKEQVMLAMRVTAEQLNQIQLRVKEARP